MVPARNLLRRQYNCYGGFLSAESSFCYEKVRFPEHMAEEPSRGLAVGGLVNGREEAEEGEEEEDVGEELARTVGKCSKTGEEEEEEEEDWLRLGIGVGVSTSTSRRSPATSSSSTPRRGTELELFEHSASAPPAAVGVGTTIPVFHLPMQHGGFFYRHDFPWGFWNTGGPAMATATSAFGQSAVETPLRRFMFPLASSGVAREGLQLFNPPTGAPVPAAGVWFLLQASQNQEREPFLPQIPKSYLRIKDGSMTVRLLKKYLVRKLGLEDESEVQIWCRGQPLHPFFTLKHVRDNIWRLRDRPPFPADPRVAEHLMTLQYGRSAQNFGCGT